MIRQDYPTNTHILLRLFYVGECKSGKREKNKAHSVSIHINASVGGHVQLKHIFQSCFECKKKTIYGFAI